MPDTSYHSWTMPTVDGSTDTWGQELNDMFDNEMDAVVERRGTLANRPGAANVPSGAKYLVDSGDDVGAIYIESGGSWQLFGRLPREAFNLGNTWHIAPQTTLDLRDELRSVLDNGYSTIGIHAPADGSAYSYASGLTVDLSNFSNGVHIDPNEDVKVDGTATGWWFDVTSPTSGRIGRNFKLSGPDAMFEYTGAGDPVGFYRATDVLNQHIEVIAEGFENSATDSTAILIRNDATWSEGWYIGGVYREVDRGINFIDIDDSHPSFRDGRIERCKVNANDFGVRLERNHKGLTINDLHLFPTADDARCLVLNGTLDGVEMHGLSFDNVQGVTGDVCIETGPDFFGGGGKPIIYGAQLNDMSNALTRGGSAHDVWELTATGAGELRFQDFGARDGSGARLEFNRSGALSVFDDTLTEVFQVAANGNITHPDGGPVQFDDPVRATEGVSMSQSGGPFLVNDDGSVYVSNGGQTIDRDLDGSGTTTNAGDLVFESDIGGAETLFRLVDATTTA